MTAGIHHFFVAPDQIHDGVVDIDGDEGRHAARVLRVRHGERISVADDTGRVVDAVVSEVGDVVRAEIERDCMVLPTTPRIVLVQAIAKSDRMDDAVMKSVEVGVARIVPFVADRSIVRWDTRRAEKARQRWTAVALAAAKQSRSARLTTIAGVSTGLPPVDPPIIALHEGAETRLREVLPSDPPAAVTLVVGPEGGLSSGELDALSRRGAHIATLGPRVLRTETAGVVAAAIVAHAYGSLG